MPAKVLAFEQVHDAATELTQMYPRFAGG